MFPANINRTRGNRTSNRACSRPTLAPTLLSVALLGWVMPTGLQSSAALAAEDQTYSVLTSAWPGPFGGLPPVDQATPAALESAYRRAVDLKRAEIRAIATQAAPPTFENTVAALDASGTALLRIDRLLRIYTGSASNEQIRAVAGRVLPLSAALDDEIAFDPLLNARISALHADLPRSAPTAEAQRLIQVVYEDLRSRGAGLDAADQSTLKEINGRLAQLMAKFGQNLAREEESLVVFVDDPAELRGLPADRIEAAKAAAVTRGKPELWAIPIQRPSVWPVLTRADSRVLRERVFRLWDGRGAQSGDFDNRPVMAEILTLRGRKARLLGYPSYAHYAAASRMVGSPETAEKMLQRAWKVLLPITEGYLAELQALAKAEGADFELQPWDRLYYAEKHRKLTFDFDSESVRPYLTLQNVIDGMTWAAERVYGLSLRELTGVPTVAPEIRVYEVVRGPQTVGVLYLDMFQRPGKGPASWATELRTAERGESEVLPIATLHSSVIAPADGSAPLLEWERANVIFHEFGHALHFIANGTRYRALGSLRVPADFIETPALLQERWLLDRGLLQRFMRHHQTRAAMPMELIERIERVNRADRVFSLNLDYLATALVDLRMHRIADGRVIDAMEIERDTLTGLSMPTMVTPLLRVAHAPHPFSELYGAAVYTYFWSDALAADIAEKFLAAPGGLYDPQVAAHYRRTILEAGNSRPMSEAFRDFRGRDPDPDALFRRFGLVIPPAADN